MEKNKVFEGVKVIDYTHEGMGVCKIDNIPVFVKYAKLGEVVDIKIIKVEKKFAFGLLVNNKEEKYICPHFKKCGGCHVMHLSYEEQLVFKKQVVNNIMTKNKIDAKVMDVMPNDNPLNYRNKI